MQEVLLILGSGENGEAFRAAAVARGWGVVHLPEPNGLPRVQGQIVGVLPTSPSAIASARQAQEWLGLPQIPATATLDKLEIKKRLAENGVRVPSFRAVRKVSECPDWRGVTVIKPLYADGGRGLIRLLPRVNREWAMAQALGRWNGCALVERWVGEPPLGVSLAVQAVMWKGECVWLGGAVTDAGHEHDPYVIETQAWTGPELNDLIQQQRGLAEIVADIFGWKNGPLALDVVLWSGSAYVVDAEYGWQGNGLLPLMNAGYGVKLENAALDLARASEPKELLNNPVPIRHVHQHWIGPVGNDVGGVVAEVAKARASEIRLRKGDVVQPMGDRRDRWGSVLAHGETPEAALLEAQRAAATLYAAVKIKGEPNDEDFD